MHWRPGRLALLSNVGDGKPLPRTPTILIDSAQLDSPEPLSKDFLAAAEPEIEAFRARLRREGRGADADGLTDKDVLREVMNTVGKPGQLGTDVRCVVSVAMLTEGWDANTVTHILGIRAFGSQLLCEQVVGRGLRRRSWAINDTGRLEPEYANIYGIPFEFIPSTAKPPPEKPTIPPVRVQAIEERSKLEIRFPRVIGYRLEIPDAEYRLQPDIAPFIVGGTHVPRMTETAGVVGQSEIDIADDKPMRAQEIGFRLAERLISTHLTASGTDDGDRRPWLFPRLARLCTDVVRDHVAYAPGHSAAELRLSGVRADLADYIYRHLMRVNENRDQRLRPILRAFDPIGTTADVDFWTRKAVICTEASHVSHVVLDGPKGNTWEQLLAAECELLAHRGVLRSYVKNDQLGFAIPYVHRGRSHSYLPDFLLRLSPSRDGIDRTLIVEVSGGQKSRFSPGPTWLKADTARHSWCQAVNNHGGFGRWDYVELKNPVTFGADLAAAIAALQADEAIPAPPDLLDASAVEPVETPRENDDGS